MSTAAFLVACACFGAIGGPQEIAPGADDLVNVAAIETLRYGGKMALADLSGAGIQEPMTGEFKFAQSALRPQRTHGRSCAAPSLQAVSLGCRISSTEQGA